MSDVLRCDVATACRASEFEVKSTLHHYSIRDTLEWIYTVIDHSRVHHTDSRV